VRRLFQEKEHESIRQNTDVESKLEAKLKAQFTAMRKSMQDEFTTKIESAR